MQLRHPSLVQEHHLNWMLHTDSPKKSSLPKIVQHSPPMAMNMLVPSLPRAIPWCNVPGASSLVCLGICPYATPPLFQRQVVFEPTFPFYSSVAYLHVPVHLLAFHLMFWLNDRNKAPGQ
jgi:hypothetical protein